MESTFFPIDPPPPPIKGEVLYTQFNVDNYGRSLSCFMIQSKSNCQLSVLILIMLSLVFYDEIKQNSPKVNK